MKALVMVMVNNTALQGAYKTVGRAFYKNNETCHNEAIPFADR